MDGDKVLQLLVQKGLVSEEDVQETARELEFGYRDIIFLLHSLLCSEDECPWEEEELLEGTWNLPHHTKWENRITVALGPIMPDQYPKIKEKAIEFGNILEVLRINDKLEDRLWTLMYQHLYDIRYFETYP